MFRTVLSYIFGRNDPELTPDDAYAVLNASCTNAEGETESKPTEDEEEYIDFSTYYKTGVITSATGDEFVIDSTYKFISFDTNIVVGSKVSFTSYIDENKKINVSNVEILENNWDCVVRNVNSKWCTHSVTCKVIERNKREIIADPGNLKINLNNVSSNFIPFVGDWLQVDVKCEIDENVADLSGKILDINEIAPLRCKQVQGIVKSFDERLQNGIIDRSIFFDSDSLCAGYVPRIGDKVVSEIIESEQGRCSWRSLKVLPEQQVGSSQLIPVQEEFLKDAQGIQVSDDVFVSCKTFNDVQKFTVDICNNRETDLLLKDMRFQNANGQCKVENDIDLRNTTIKSKCNIQIKCLCKPKTYGTSKELLLFLFNDFKIGRWISISCDVPVLTNQLARSQYSNRNNPILNKQNFTGGTQQDVLKGQRPVLPPRFISNKLLEYRVPQKLWDIVLSLAPGSNNALLLCEELRRIKPSLRALSFHTYEDYFHTLIHLEDIANVMQMQNYNQEMACFIKNGEYLMLEIENLSEKRPSLMVGDKIIAKDPYNPNSLQLEGFIHKVGAKHVYIKFGHVFHDTYKGEDYSITAVASRTTFKKKHQAVGLAVRNLGRDFLFPTKVDVKEPQVTFFYDEYDNTLSSVDKKIKDRTSIVNNSVIQTAIDEQKNTTGTKLLLQKEEEKTSRSRNMYKKSNISKNTNNKVKNLKLDWYDKSLNYYQKEAVRNILLGEARPLPYVIFGPPGTGKTVTLIETILQILRLMPDARILVGTPSNSAADVLALRLIHSGLLKPGDLVRFVAYKCIVDNSIPVDLVPYCATGDLARDGSRNYNGYTVTDNGLTLGINSSVLGRHRVTVSTCSNLGLLHNMGFPKGHFTHIIVDEAGQLTEPEIMISLAFLDVTYGQCVLAGDPMQLGPVILSPLAGKCGLGESYLERLLIRFPYARDIQGFPNTGGFDPRLVTKLVYNYRSLPDIISLSSRLFYNSELKPTISPTDSEEADLLNKIKEILPVRKNGTTPSMMFHGIEGENYQTPDSPSWFNPHEASQVFFYINELYRLGVKNTDIGVISPYSKQIQQIRLILNEAEFDMPKLGTVEEFQGQEFNIVLLSVVRSIENLVQSDVAHSIGFISSPRRLNVALTRAQTLLIIIGNPNVLSKDSYWRSVLSYCIENEAYCGCEINVS